MNLSYPKFQTTDSTSHLTSGTWKFQTSKNVTTPKLQTTNKHITPFSKIKESSPPPRASSCDSPWPCSLQIIIITGTKKGSQKKIKEK